MQGVYFVEDPFYKVKKLRIDCSWNKNISDFILKHNIKALCLNYAGGWQGDNINFLSDLKELNYFEIIDRNISDISGVNELNNLEFLKIFTYCKTKIDFSNFPKLRKCIFEWRKGCESLFDCRTLEHLFLVNYDGKNFRELSRLKELRRLHLIDSKIEDISEIRLLTKMNYLELTRLKKLTLIDPLAELTSLESLSVDTCKGITDIEPLGKLSKLRELFLDNLGEINSLKVLASCRELEFLHFHESTKVLDGELGFLQSLPRLYKIRFQNRRHYSHKWQELDKDTSVQE